MYTLKLSILFTFIGLSLAENITYNWYATKYANNITDSINITFLDNGTSIVYFNNSNTSYLNCTEALISWDKFNIDNVMYNNYTELISSLIYGMLYNIIYQFNSCYPNMFKNQFECSS